MVALRLSSVVCAFKSKTVSYKDMRMALLIIHIR